MRSIVRKSPPKRRKTRAFFVRIGRKGGRGGKGSEAKRRSALKAANARWTRAGKRNLILTMRGDMLMFSRGVPGIRRVLTGHVRKREGQAIVTTSDPYLFDDDGVAWTLPTLLDRVRSFLDQKSVPYRIKWQVPPAHRLARCDFRAATEVLNFREGRDIGKLLRAPVGALCRVREDRRVDVMGAVLAGFRSLRAVVVVEELDRLCEVRTSLHNLLGEPIGILTNEQADGRRITVMTPQYLASHVIGKRDCEVLIFERVPRTGAAYLLKAGINFHPIWRLGFMGDEIRGADRLLRAEAQFGPLVRMPAFE
jgi:hypothetical protein